MSGISSNYGACYRHGPSVTHCRNQPAMLKGVACPRMITDSSDRISTLISNMALDMSMNAAVVSIC